MRKKKNLKKLLNLEMVDYTNLTPKYGELDMPYIRCNVIPDIDFFATYSQPSTYFRTTNTCVTFFEYDIYFDGLYGLWNAIYYGIKELQDFYLERFKGVRYFVSPDYSKCGDVCEIENQHRQYRSRIVSIWLTTNLNALVIPLISTANDIGMDYSLDGMKDCSVVAFNMKGPMGDKKQLEIQKRLIKHTVDNLPNLKVIYVYSASPNKEKIFEIFRYAIEAEIDVRIPENTLQIRNKLLGGGKNGIN